MSFNEYRILWYDPGGTLGWAMLGFDRRAFSRPEHTILGNLNFWDCGEFSGAEQEVLRQAVGLIDETINAVGFIGCCIGGEDFDKTNTPGSEENVFSPVRQNAVLEWECGKRGVSYQYQKRSIRTSVTKKRLKLWGFEGRLKRNEFAAIQHAIVKARRIKDQSIRSPWKLNTKDIHGAYWDCACARKKKCDLVHG